MAGEKQKKCGEKQKNGAGEARKRSGRNAKKRCGKGRKGRARNLVNAEKYAGENRRSAREIREKVRRNAEKAREGCAALYWAGICFETGFERVDGRERMRAGVPAGLACLPLRFALFSGANLAPLKTALSHGFIGLGASKTGAEKRACGPGCGRRKGAGKARKRSGKKAEKAREKRKEKMRERRKGCARNLGKC